MCSNNMARFQSNGGKSTIVKMEIMKEESEDMRVTDTKLKNEDTEQQREETQDPPEVYVRFKGGPITIMKIATMAGDDEMAHAPADAREGQRDNERMIMSARSGRTIKRIPHKYSSDVAVVSTVQTDDAASDQPNTQTEVWPNDEEAGEPTSQVFLRKAKQTIEIQKEKIVHLEEKVKSLTEERNYLRERLQDALNLKGEAVQSNPPQHLLTPPSSSAAKNVDRSSESSDSSDSEPTPKKKNKSDKQRGRINKKKSKKLMANYSKRVRTPEDSIKRYYNVLKLVKQGLTKTEAYNRLNVDRNTIVIQAPIAELAAANPEAFKALRESFKKGDSVQKFAESCLTQCRLHPNVDVIHNKKEIDDLLDISKK
ncbi:coiled-coil domain-containing protein 106-like isoform X2 [Myxocyprinus asiaticus]|uniref:coiled-coil domain-containing protein 106-like isoform X2 n=1 Tax=Myxocyprinus asiaticus TaxID=70543 RepID=UPI002221AD2E|nr:coiled-coil domain-containing protein 106-like isoform X2 [Myxocyprinus asiaticus]